MTNKEEVRLAYPQAKIYAKTNRNDGKLYRVILDTQTALGNWQPTCAMAWRSAFVKIKLNTHEQGNIQ